MGQNKVETSEWAKVETVPSTVPVPHVYRAIADVTAALAKVGIGKDRVNEGQRFKYRGIDDVYDALAPALVASDLVVLPSYKTRQESEREGKSGSLLFTSVVEAVYVLVSARDGSSVEVGPFWGQAFDSGDKGTNKAMSAAFKYFAFQTFCVPLEGDDADATTHEVAARPKAPVQARHEPSAPSAPSGSEGMQRETVVTYVTACDQATSAKTGVTWYKITLADDRKAVTRDEKLFRRADNYLATGQEVSATITSSRNGGWFLDAIEATSAGDEPF
jgi:ERF superfamily